MKSGDLEILKQKPHLRPANIAPSALEDSSSNSDELPHPLPRRVLAPTATYSHHGYVRGKETSYSQKAFSPARREAVVGRSPAAHERSAQRLVKTPSEKLGPSNAGTTGTAAHRSCNCKRSNCLKLYCDCFASGEYCGNCNCNCCFNNVENESARTAAIRSILDRNPGAFRPKIASAHMLPLSPAFQEADLPASKHNKVSSAA